MSRDTPEKAGQYALVFRHILKSLYEGIYEKLMIYSIYRLVQIRRPHQNRDDPLP